MNSEPKDRLQEARKRAGFDSPTAAAEHFGWGYSTYAGHENGSRGLKPEVAARWLCASGRDPRPFLLALAQAADRYIGKESWRR